MPRDMSDVLDRLRFAARGAQNDMPHGQATVRTADLREILNRYDEMIAMQPRDGDGVAYVDRSAWERLTAAERKRIGWNGVIFT